MNEFEKFLKVDMGRTGGGRLEGMEEENIKVIGSWPICHLMFTIN